MTKIESGLQLQDVYANNLILHKNEEFSVEGSVNYDPEIGFKISEINEDGSFCARLKYEITENPQNFPFQLSAEVEGKFIFIDRESEKDMEKFFPSILSILFPFVRALITQVTGGAGFQPLIIPLVDTIKLTKAFQNLRVEEKEN